MTQAFPIALFQHPLLLTLRAFHVLFGTDRKPFHCFTTWILTLMKEMLHLITEPLKRAPFPNEQTRRQCIPAALTSSAQADPACRTSSLLLIPAGWDLTSGPAGNMLFPCHSTGQCPGLFLTSAWHLPGCKEKLHLRCSGLSSPMANSEASDWRESVCLKKSSKKKHPVWEDINWHLRHYPSWCPFCSSAFI